MRRLLFFLMMGACLSLSASNDEKKTVEVNSLVYLLDDETMTAEVTGLTSYKGVFENQGVLEIPASVTFEGSNYSVTSIGSNAFRDKTGIKQVIMPESIITIGEAAFSECKFDAVNIPDGVQEIQRHAFSNNGWLQTVKIGKGIKTIAPNVFFMTALKTIVIEANSIPEADDTSFGDWTYDLQTRKPILYVPEELVNSYRESNDFPWVYFEDSRIVAIGTEWKEPEQPVRPEVVVDNMVYYLNVDDHTAEIKDGKAVMNAFPRDEAFMIPDVITVEGSAYSVVSIGERAFAYCSSLAPYEVIVPNSVTCIRKFAFKDSNSIKILRIGKGVEKIEAGAFHGISLQEMYIYAEHVPQTEWFESDLSWNYFSQLNKLYVPAELVEAYRESELIYWKDVKDENILPMTETSIGEVKPDSKEENYEYRPMIEDGKVWKVGSKKIKDNIVKLVGYYYFDGDTIIGGKTCKKMMFQQYVTPDYPEYDAVIRFPLLQYVGAWYEEDKKVYFCNDKTPSMKIMYDFSLDENDIIYFLVEGGYQPYLGPKQTGGIEGFKGVYRDVLMGNNVFNTTWLEGVGGVEGPTFNAYQGKEYHTEFLMSCTVGDEVIYLNDEYEDGATPMDAEAKKHRFDFTHTIKTKPQTRGEEEEQSLYGEYNNLLLGINLEPLDEAYLVRITNESDQVVYEKTINAGSIVGLNIDISAFAKGRYTVTIENSGESFTGEFETITTGIQELINEEETKNFNSSTLQFFNSIYNLQGQRLNRLQKGLNIVNGRKVFVK